MIFSLGGIGEPIFEHLVEPLADNIDFLQSSFSRLFAGTTSYQQK